MAADALGAPVVEMQLTVTTYFLGLAAGQLLWGPPRPASGADGRTGPGARRLDRHDVRGLGACALILPSATAAALTPFPKAAGTASSLMGATQFVLGAAVATLLGALYDGSARSMATLTAVAGLAAFGLERWRARRVARTAAGV